MLLSRTHAWTRRQKWLLVSSVVLALAVFGAFIYGVERYYRGPGEEILYGTWEGPADYHGSDAYIQFDADHTFSLWDRAWFARPDSKPEFVTKGRWYAGGRFVYLRFPSTYRPDGPALQILHIDDISPREFRLRQSRDGEVYVFRRVDGVTTNASNQAMQLTAPRSVSPLRVATIFNLQPSALPGAVADLVSR